MIDLFEQKPRVKRNPRRRAPGAGRPSAVTTRACDGEVGQPVDHDLTEDETAVVLEVSRQTLRNMRLGYKNAYGPYPPKLVKDVHWYKFRLSKRAPVLFKLEWVNKMLDIKRLKSEIGL